MTKLESLSFGERLAALRECADSHPLDQFANLQDANKARINEGPCEGYTVARVHELRRALEKMH